MSPGKPLSIDGHSWQQSQARAITEPAELLQALGLPTELLHPAQQASGEFRLRVPEAYLRRIEPGNAADPLLRQVLPLGEELVQSEGYVQDPVGDGPSRALPGLLHKYQGRVLIITTAACGIHCRYCFRRHYPYGDDLLHEAQWQQILHYLRADPGIHEVILSGGDPLTLSDQRLQERLEDLAGIPHLKRLRLHSRQPVVLPERVTPRLLRLLGDYPLQVVLVVHVNHANELDAEVEATMQGLRAAGITLLNQSVLLAGVNDGVQALQQLSERLFACHILPYYLHQLDRVQGAAHFEVPLARARELMRQLRERLPGYLVPRLVSEQAGAASKLPVELLAASQD